MPLDITPVDTLNVADSARVAIANVANALITDPNQFFQELLRDGIAFAFSFHLFVHFGQAILFRGYVPGVVTSLIVLPYSLYGLWSIWLITSGIEFMLLAICGIVFIGVNLKFAHWLGMKRLQKKRQSRSYFNNHRMWKDCSNSKW